MGAKTKIQKYIKEWEQKGYENGIPDEAPIEMERRNLVPSYRMVCFAFMRNPNNLEMLGMKRTKCKIYNDIKREEIYRRKTKYKQLNLFM